MFVFVYVQKYATSIADFSGMVKIQNTTCLIIFNNTHARYYLSSKDINIISWEHVNNIDALLHGFIRYPYLSQGGIL